jgi:hypothetical protein
MIVIILCVSLIANLIVISSETNQQQPLWISPYDQYMKYIFKRTPFTNDQIDFLNMDLKSMNSNEIKRRKYKNGDKLRRAKVLRKFFVNRQINDF